MIHDTLDSVTTRWLELQSHVLKLAFDWLRAMPVNPPEGQTKLQGHEMYVNVHGYRTLPATDCQWESRRDSVDIQYCIAGGEIIEWLPTGVLAPMGDYFPAKDTEHWFGKDEPATQLKMLPGVYAIFLPNELHRPKLADGTIDHVKKLVIKIRSKLLRN